MFAYYHSHGYLDMAPCLHISTHMDMDMTLCLQICHFKYIIHYWLLQIWI